MAGHVNRRSHVWATAVAGAALVGLVVPGVATGATGGPAAGVVTGRVNLPGYTVVALGFNGKVAVTRARRFSLRAPANEFTLQLVNSRGK